MRRPPRIRAALVAALLPTGAPSLALATPCPQVGFAFVDAAVSPQTRPVAFRQGRTLFVHRDAITTTADIAEASLDLSGEDARLQIKLTPAGAERLERATTDHDGARFALVAGDEALMAVTWQGRYGFGRDGVQISMSDKARATALVGALQRCVGAVRPR